MRYFPNLGAFAQEFTVMHTGKLSVRYGMLRELIGLLVFCITKNKLEYNFTQMHFQYKCI